MADDIKVKKSFEGREAPQRRKIKMGVNADQGDITSKWWMVDEDKAHLHINAVVSEICKHQEYRALANLKYARLYANKNIGSFAASAFNATSKTLDRSNSKLSYNVVRSAIDTISSKIGKMKPRPVVLTSEGNFPLQQKAKKLTKYLEGALDSAEAYDNGRRIFVDACVFGTGVMKIFWDEDVGRIMTERVFIDEMIIDEAEGFHGKPRQIHQRRVIDRAVVAEMFGYDENGQPIEDIIAAIERAPKVDAKSGRGARVSADQIEVIESWHLRSGKNADDGKHAIAIDGKTLLFEEYDKDSFPFLFFRWSDSLLGFFGTGIAEELTGIQIEINKILRTIARAQKVTAVPRVFIERGSRIVKSHINNDEGSIIEYTGTAPSFQAPASSITPDMFTHLETIYRKAFEVVGVSLLSATSKKPAGLNAGVALREQQDIETERFALTAQRFEEFYIDLSSKIVEISRDMFENNPELKITAKGKKFIETIPWKDVDMQDDMFMMKTYPASLLPKTPAGKLQTTQELIQSQLISPEEGLSLLDYPDLESVMSLRNAAIDNVKDIIATMLDKGEYISPEPFMDLTLSLDVAQNSYLRAKIDRVDEEKLDLLRRFMEDIITLQKLAAAPTEAEIAAQQAMQAQEPIAEGRDQPNSDFLPFE